MGQNLMKEFSEVSRSEWKDKIISDLKGKAYEELLWRAEGLGGEPIYTKENLASETLSSQQNGAISSDPQLFGLRHWTNNQLIVVDNEELANREALTALNSGAEGLVFQLNGLTNFDKLLKDIQPEYCSISFESQLGLSLLEAYSDYLKNQGTDLSKISGFLNSAVGVQNVPSDLGAFKWLQIALDDKEKDLNVPSQLALLLHKASNRLVEMSSDQAFKALQFELSFGKNYFLEIAKVRALRVLAVALAKGFGKELSQQEISILSSSGDWDHPVEDVYNYLLEATTSAMAAIIGGCNGLLIRPLSTAFRDQPQLAIRNARNISSILKEESYLNKVVDPSAGSYFIESLTSDLINKAWADFLELGKLGTDDSAFEYLKSLES